MSAASAPAQGAPERLRVVASGMLGGGAVRKVGRG
jgi:hypothetical protein